MVNRVADLSSNVMANDMMTAIGYVSCGHEAYRPNTKFL